MPAGIGAPTSISEAVTCATSVVAMLAFRKAWPALENPAELSQACGKLECCGNFSSEPWLVAIYEAGNDLTVKLPFSDA